MSVTAEKPRTGMRRVEVDDPRLRPETNARMTALLREVVGADEVEVPADRAHPSHGEVVSGTRDRAFGTSGALISVIGAFAAITVGAIVATSVLNSYWIMALAMVLDAVGLVFVAVTVVRMTSVTERPDAATVADLQSEGILNPERFFSEIVEEFRQPAPDGDGHRDTAVEDDHAQAASEQRSALTPTGGPSTAVGPGE